MMMPVQIYTDHHGPIMLVAVGSTELGRFGTMIG